MGTTAQKLQRLLNTKLDIKRALTEKGYNPGDRPFKDYGSIIMNITTPDSPIATELWLEGDDGQISDFYDPDMQLYNGYLYVDTLEGYDASDVKRIYITGSHLYDGCFRLLDETNEVWLASNDEGGDQLINLGTLTLSDGTDYYVSCGNFGWDYLVINGTPSGSGSGSYYSSSSSGSYTELDQEQIDFLSTIELEPTSEYDEIDIQYTNDGLSASNTFYNLGLYITMADVCSDINDEEMSTYRFEENAITENRLDNIIRIDMTDSNAIGIEPKKIILYLNDKNATLTWTDGGGTVFNY